MRLAKKSLVILSTRALQFGPCDHKEVPATGTTNLRNHLDTLACAKTGGLTLGA
jgi:hypothetical protein